MGFKVIKSKKQKRRFLYILLPIFAFIVIGIILYPASTKKESRVSKTTGMPMPTVTEQDKIRAANPLYGLELYVDPVSNATKQAEIWRTTRPEDAAKMDVLASLPVAKWVNNLSEAQAVNEYVKGASENGKTAIIVTYNFPHRDCGGYSAGGAKSEAEYRMFIDTLKAGIGSNSAIVILEPDALSHTQSRKNNGQPCLTYQQQETYFRLMKYAVDTLKSSPNTYVYIDAGNSAWVKDQEAVGEVLRKGGVDNANGFSLNVSNFQTTADTIRFGNVISEKLGNKHFVIDTSRNGLGAFINDVYPGHDWCNPPGRALGAYPSTDTGVAYLDAYLYIKRPGESDGADRDPNKCFGGPKAGTWWPEYAVGLVERWPKELQNK